MTCTGCSVHGRFVINGLYIQAYRNSWALDTRVGRWTLDAGPWTLDAGFWTLNARLWTLKL